MDTKARLAWRILNVSPSEADLYIYDSIGDPFDGTLAGDFVQELRALDVGRINVHINSPGGYVNHALAMYNALLQHPAEVVGYVEGSADSAASFVLQAADKRVIAKNASMFIHCAHGLVYGDAEDMIACAQELEEESVNIANIYAERAGGTAADWLAAMSAGGGVARGTKYRGQEAVDAGLADEVAAAPARTRAYAGRVAAQAAASIPEPPSGADAPEIDLSLIPPLAGGGYRPPIPADFTRLLEANLKGA